jgi:hypothetical protein
VAAGDWQIHLGNRLASDHQREARTAFAGDEILRADLAAAIAHADHASLGTTLEVVVEIAAGGNEQRTLLRQAAGQRTFLLRDRFAAAHVFNMGRSDVRDDAQVRSRDLAQWCDLAGMVHAHLEDRGTVALLQR